MTLQDFVRTLAARKPQPKNPPPPAPTEFWKEPFTLRPAERITITRMIDRLDEQLDDEHGGDRRRGRRAVRRRRS